MIEAKYIDHMGDDLRTVNAARVSFDKESHFFENKDRRLVDFLSRENHFTPFTHCQITLRETVPIFVARQRFKHTVGFTYNEISRRYVSTTPEVYMPKEWRSKAEDKKQGSGDAIELKPTLDFQVWQTIDSALQTYDDLIEAGVCPEQARMVLPQGMMTSYYVTGSLSAFARAYLLRSQSDSQKEIQELAKQWNEIISPLFPHSWNALIK